MNRPPDSQFKYYGQSLLEVLVKKYIDENSLDFYTRYHDKRTEGAVILFFKDGNIYQQRFLTKDEIAISADFTVVNDNGWEDATNDSERVSFLMEGLNLDFLEACNLLSLFQNKNILSLHSNAFQDAKMYWNNYPDKLVVMSYSYPISRNAKFWDNKTSRYFICAIDSSLLNQKSNNSDCFVVTATFDDPDGVTIIDKYRNFRDVYLKKNFIGSILVYCYYIVGPHLASVIRSSQLLKSISKKVLTFIANFLPKTGLE